MATMRVKHFGCQKWELTVYIFQSLENFLLITDPHFDNLIPDRSAMDLWISIRSMDSMGFFGPSYMDQSQKRVMEKNTGIVRPDLVCGTLSLSSLPVISRRSALCTLCSVQQVHHHNLKEAESEYHDSEWRLRSAIASPCCASKT